MLLLPPTLLRPKVRSIARFLAGGLINLRNQWRQKVSDVTRSQGVQVFLDSTGDLASWVFPLLGPFGRWIIYGVRKDQQNALPAEGLWTMIEQNISVSGINLERHLQDVPRDSTREHEIRRRAFEIYLERGSEPGRDLEEWLQAERELTTDKSKTASA